MSQHLRELASLQAHYEDVIQSHKHLATVFSNLVDTVVDGRLPDHDLAAMLRDLAEREDLMAANWGFVRDGLIERMRSDLHEWTIEVTTDIDSDEEAEVEDDDRRDTRCATHSSWEGIENTHQPVKQGSIAKHLAKALTNAVKLGADQDPSSRPIENANPQTKKEQPIRTNVEPEVYPPEWQRSRTSTERQHQARKTEHEAQLVQVESMNPVTHQYRKKRKCRVTRRRLAEGRAALSHGTQEEVEHVRLKRIKKERLDRERKTVREYNAKEAMRNVRVILQQYPRLTQLVRGIDGRVIKQEADD